MPTTVGSAFDSFRKNTVDLDSSIVTTARNSRRNLAGQLTGLKDKVSGYPPVTHSYIHYGSFARRTKTRPLDDIDLMVLLDGTGGREYQPPGELYQRRVVITNANAPLAPFKDARGYVNSTKILNKIRDSLGSLTQYEKADVKKSMNAVTLKLKSYTWVYDIVPALGVTDPNEETRYYLIPDGHGDWIRTDPRIDQKNITEANQRLSNQLLPVLRLLKYWNKRPIKPTLPAYYFESLALKVFASSFKIDTLQQGVKFFFDNLYVRLWNTCSDPKGLGPNLDADVDPGIKLKVDKARKEAASNASFAIFFEEKGDHKTAIGYWKKIFGVSFPDYG